VLGIARGPRRARALLVVLGVALVLSLLVWVRSFAGWLAIPSVAALVLLFAKFGSPRECMLLAQFVGLRLAMDTVSGSDYLFVKEVVVDGKTRLSDIGRVAEVLGGPYQFWGVLIAALSFALVGLSLYAAWRKPKQRKVEAPAA
jgi:Peptidase M50B-like